MKKFFKFAPAFLAISLLLILTGCGGNTGRDNNTENSRAGVPGENAEENSMQQPSVAPAAGKSLVVYFSWSGNTEQMATWIAQESGSDVYRITPREPYSSDYNDVASRAKSELDGGIRPSLENLMDTQTMAQYSTLYVGFPVWWYDLPMPVLAFLESYNLSGKTVLPFFSHNGSSSGAGSLSTLASACSNANVQTGEAFSISGNLVNQSEDQIREWVRSMYNKSQ